ncbi:MAG: 50S ribosomal protein L10 [Coriobacteriales bacterium]|jgi:large subunit ribosomal protein L10
MPNIAKEEKVRDIKADLEKATAVWVVDYRGLTVKQSESLRGAIREADAQLKVLKNTLTQRALAELELPTMDEILAGPSAFVFTNGDPVAAAKVLKTFGKDNKNLVIKGGIMDGREVNAEQVQAIAELPSREELIAKLLGTLQNPMQGIVRVLNGPMEQFARVVDAIKDTKVA